MNVLFICRTNLNMIGGDVTHVGNLLAELEKERDLNLVVISRYNSYYKKDNPSYCCSSPFPFGHNRNLLADYVKSIFKSLRYCLTNCSNNCIIYERFSKFSYGFWVANFFKKKHIVELNAFFEDEVNLIYHDTTKYKIIKKVITFNTKRACKIAKKVVVVTDRMKDRLAKDYNIDPNKIIVINNAVDVHKFRPIKSNREKELKKVELKLNPKLTHVCFVGTFYEWQGLEYLIQSAPLILKEIPNAKFLIVGDGPMKKELVNLATKTSVSDKFIFTGAVPYDEVPNYITASDVCVAPFIRARNERIGLSPLKIYEYLACGKPIVSSRIPDLEFIEQTNLGILVEPENPKELSEAIIKLLNDKKLREEMGKNGREYVVKDHSWVSVAKRVAEVCESVVREHKNKTR